MNRVHFYVCLMACLVTMLASCKKESEFEMVSIPKDGVHLGESQASRDRCGTDQRMQELYLKRQGYRSEIIEGRTFQMTKYAEDHSRDANELPLLTIPVHIIYKYTERKIRHKKTAVR